MAMAHGNHCGPLFAMHQQHVTFLCASAASRDAWESANATVSVSDAQYSANAKVGALTTETTASNRDVKKRKIENQLMLTIFLTFFTKKSFNRLFKNVISVNVFQM